MSKIIDTIHIMDSIEHTRMIMPKYYPASRCGPHKNKKKYDRKQSKKELKKLIEEG